ncbi:MAG: flotillin-like protein FloA [Christensenellaceae bacterium]|nr:flotillin-like protein FloA [Christensenellaceae bacterium]
MSGEEIVTWAIILVSVIVLITFLSMVNIGLWFRAILSGTYVSMGELIAINVKHLNAKYIVDNYIKARKAGVDITVNQIQNHIQAHGNIEMVINALIASHNANIDLPTATALAIDLAGRDVNDAVKHTITPQVVEMQKITAVAKNGIEVSVVAKITLRVNLKRIIGGALEETIIARVAEGIVTAIGNARDHNELLEKPDKVTKIIMNSPTLASDTAFDILSIDISDIEVGRNIGAELEIDKAEAIKYISQADAEKRRSEAIASEQEMRALTQEMRARVVAAEANVPIAIARALKQGNITVTDYLKFKNIQSDTAMRNAISGSGDGDMLALPIKKKTKIT